MGEKVLSILYKYINGFLYSQSTENILKHFARSFQKLLISEEWTSLITYGDQMQIRHYICLINEWLGFVNVLFQKSKAFDVSPLYFRTMIRIFWQILQHWWPTQHH